MGKSAPSQPTESNVTQTTSNLPEYARPYFENLINRGMAWSNNDYTPYPYERIAGFTPAQQQVQQNTLGLTAPNQFATGSGLAAAAGQGSLMAANYAPTQFRAQQIGMPNLQQYRMEGPGTFTQEGTANQFMSPYMQQVVDVQKEQAIRDARQGQIAQDLGAARQGTYGGSRQLLAGLERERNLGTQLGQIQATGQQTAFQQAQEQFNREQAAQQAAGQANLQAALGTQQLGTQTGLQALLANQQQALEAQRLAEQSKQFGAQNQLAALGQAGQMGQTLGNLGQYQQQADLQRLQAQGAAAGQAQAMEQQYLDQYYQDFLRQRDYPVEQLGYLSNLLRGLPVGLSSTQTTYAPSPSMASQVLGAGLGGLSMYNMGR
jgi:hypothetical protein